MSTELAQHISTLSQDGIRIHIWPTSVGFQANVAETGSSGWTCHTAEDPITALLVVLRQRCGRVADRTVIYDDDMPVPDVSNSTDSRQIDIEEAIASATADEDEDLIG